MTSSNDVKLFGQPDTRKTKNIQIAYIRCRSQSRISVKDLSQGRPRELLSRARKDSPKTSKSISEVMKIVTLYFSSLKEIFGSRPNLFLFVLCFLYIVKQQ